MGSTKFFCTWDIGELIGPQQVRVIDRCKSHFKLSQGMFVAPEPVEAALRASPFVRMAFVLGAGHMSNVAAVVVPSHELVEALNVEANGQSTPPCESLLDACMHEAHRSRARSLVLSSVHQCCKAAQLKAWETPQTLILEAEPFSDANGLLNPVGKLCRPL